MTLRSALSLIVETFVFFLAIVAFLAVIVAASVKE